MESKSRFSKEYDPANPRRARNRYDLDWAPLQDTVTRYHTQGVSRPQMVRLLWDEHGFFASTSQLNKQMARWKLFTKRKAPRSNRTDLASAYIPSTHDLPDHASKYHHKGTTNKFAGVPVTGFGTISTFAAPQTDPGDTLSYSSSSDGHLCSEADPCYTSQRPSATTHLANPGSRSCPIPVGPSSPGSASRESSTTANYLSPITDLSNERPTDGQGMASLFKLIEKITEYQPGTDATRIWTDSERAILGPTASEVHDAASRQWCTSLELWQSMGNVADALTAAGQFSSAFDLHHICFVQIFIYATKNAEQISLPDDLLRLETEHDAPTRKLLYVIANKSPVLQLLVKAAIGIARSCSDLDHTKLACSALDAVLCIAGELESVGTFRFLAALFDCYGYEMGGAGWRRRGGRPFDLITALELEALHSLESKQSRETEWLKVIHPTIKHREYLTFISRLTSSHVAHLPSAFGLPNPSADLFTVLRSASYPYYCNPESVVQDDLLPSFPPEYISLVITHFLDQCHTMIIEELATLDSYTKVESLTDEGLEDATFTLYWFLIYKKGLLEVDSKQPERVSVFPPAPFLQTGYHSTNLDAFFVLCRLVASLFARDFGSHIDFSIGAVSLSNYAMEAMYQIRQSPHEFLNRYFQQVLCLRPLVDSSSLTSQPTTEHKHVQSTILNPPFGAWKLKVAPTRNAPYQPGDDINELPATDRASLSRQGWVVVAPSRFESAPSGRKAKSTHLDPSDINNENPVKSPMGMPPPPQRPASPPAPSVITTSSGLSEDTKTFRRLARRVNEPGASGYHVPDDKSDSHGFEPPPSWDFEDVTGMPRAPLGAEVLAGITGVPEYFSAAPPYI